MAIRGFLFGVSPLDPVTVGSAISIIGITALAASVLPARAAVRVDPATMLRTQ
jgi:ABC-type lipoprotein release transport system permease subunit